MSYAELCAASNFTFLKGASHAEELVQKAAELGLSGIAITDINTFAGIVRAHTAAKKLDVRFLVGVRLVFTDTCDILAYPTDRAAYGRLSRLLTLGKRRTTKGKCELQFADLIEWAEGNVLIVMGKLTKAKANTLQKSFAPNVYIGMAPLYDGRDKTRFATLAEFAGDTKLPLVAVGDVLMHTSSRRMLADILSCIREKTTIDKLGCHALKNSERRIKSEFEMHRLFRRHPEAMSNTQAIVTKCKFSLDELRYEYPDEVMNGQPPNERLRELTEEGLKRRYPDGESLRVRKMVEKELALIARLDYSPYFLTVNDIVAFARSQGILCQGRGSAANSVVCYALGITEASPEIIAMVFERFISEVRNEPPDIDVDFEHERREEVIQHIYEKFGRHRAGICSTVIHFKNRSAIRQVGKAMGLSDDTVAALSSQVWGTSSKGQTEKHIKEAGLDLHNKRLMQTLSLATEIIGFPRHLSQHVGGFVITRGRLDELCPVENAAMLDRTIIEWDKNDIDELGMLKIDILALGMLSCIRKAFTLLTDWKGQNYTLASVPQEDRAVYDMLCVADTVGVFQVESRAQMNFLPRMRPRTYYDLVIEVAIIRPGPIQGGMIHPYLKRRHGDEPVVYPSKDLESVLHKTLGVPLFQEQAMQIAVVAAGFCPGEADQLRRALGSFRGPGTVKAFRTRFIEGCLMRGYEQEFANACFKQLEGFSGYGFPESHAASFALLVYVSSWLKCHHPEIFACALLNSQPMGFYAPAQIIRDVRDHDVEVLPICVEHSFWDNTLEPHGGGKLALRLGFRQIKGFKEDDGHWLSAARGNGYRSADAIWRRAGLSKTALTKLASANAFASHEINRREAVWQVKGFGGEKPLPLFQEHGEGLEDVTTDLPAMTIGEHVFEDYVATRFTLNEHPVQLLRSQIKCNVRADQLRDIPDKTWVSITGLVITRQRPGTASGVVFLTLEDETGVSNVVVWPKTFEKHRKTVMAGRLLKITGKLQREGIVTHIISNRIEDFSYLLNELGDIESFKDGIVTVYGKADEAKNPIPVKEGAATDKKRPTLNPRITYGVGARHPREQAKKLFYSRDFH